MRVANTLALALFAAAVLSAATASAETVLMFNQWVPATHHFHARIVKP